MSVIGVLGGFYNVCRVFFACLLPGLLPPCMYACLYFAYLGQKYYEDDDNNVRHTLFCVILAYTLSTVCVSVL